MARISPVSAVASPTDQLDAELGRLLDRLQHSILYVDADREHALRASEFERTRVERVGLHRYSESVAWGNHPLLICAG